ncbi:MAG: hypothetical protein ACI8P9_004236 [Parasphingorhabdus sp.]|jgi:hypothetical protein
MKLEGSCHCKKVQFSLNSPHPYPYNYCYCSICRKTAGGGGYAINLGADATSLKTSGEEFLSIYQATITDTETGETSVSPAKRHFCSCCGSALWAWDSRWPELIHPFASAIDTPLPVAPEHTHLLLDSKASWVEPNFQANDQQFEKYPSESLAAWHQRFGVESTD